MGPYATPSTQRSVSLVGRPSEAIERGRSAGPVSSRIRPHRDRRELADSTQSIFDRAARTVEAERSELLEQVITDHLWLADSIARRFAGRGEDTDDLVQVARSGLVEAVRRYDPSAGSFIGYAVPTITGVVKRHFRDHGWLVRPPRATQEAVTQINREWSSLVQELGGEPDDRAVARRIGQPVSMVREARQAGRGYSSASLETAMNSESALDADEVTSELSRTEDRLVVARAWRQISRDERQLLAMRFFEDRSQSDIAAEIGTSQMQVSRLLQRTLHKMRALIAGTESIPLAS